MTIQLRVLIVDDDPHVARLHSAFVASRNDEVIATVGTGPDAVTATHEGRPDVVLLDMHLPGFSGLEVLRRVRAQRGPQPEVIAVTAARDIDTVREARRLGVRHYLAKPFTADDLRTRLDELRTELAAAPIAKLEQREIDAVMTGQPGARPLPKGISAETLSTVATALVNGPPRSAGEVADALGLSRVSVRRYLEHLVEDGRAERTMDYATAGRPRMPYGPRM